MEVPFAILMLKSVTVCESVFVIIAVQVELNFA